MPRKPFKELDLTQKPLSNKQRREVERIWIGEGSTRRPVYVLYRNEEGESRTVTNTLECEEFTKFIHNWGHAYLFIFS